MNGRSMRLWIGAGSHNVLHVSSGIQLQRRVETDLKEPLVEMRLHGHCRAQSRRSMLHSLLSCFPQK